MVVLFIVVTCRKVPVVILIFYKVKLLYITLFFREIDTEKSKPELNKSFPADVDMVRYFHTKYVITFFERFDRFSCLILVFTMNLYYIQVEEINYATTVPPASANSYLGNVADVSVEKTNWDLLTKDQMHSHLNKLKLSEGILEALPQVYH